MPILSTYSAPKMAYSPATGISAQHALAHCNLNSVKFPAYNCQPTQCITHCLSGTHTSSSLLPNQQLIESPHCTWLLHPWPMDVGGHREYRIYMHLVAPCSLRATYKQNKFDCSSCPATPAVFCLKPHCKSKSKKRTKLPREGGTCGTFSMF